MQNKRPAVKYDSHEPQIFFVTAQSISTLHRTNVFYNKSENWVSLVINDCMNGCVGDRGTSIDFICFYVYFPLIFLCRYIIIL